MEYLIFIIGLVLGSVLTSIYTHFYYHKKKANGTLKVNTNDPDGPYLFLQISKKDMATIMNKNEITLQIEHVSQK